MKWSECCSYSLVFWLPIFELFERLTLVHELSREPEWVMVEAIPRPSAFINNAGPERSPLCMLVKRPKRFSLVHPPGLEPGTH